MPDMHSVQLCCRNILTAALKSARHRVIVVHLMTSPSAEHALNPHTYGSCRLVIHTGLAESWLDATVMKHRLPAGEWLEKLPGYTQASQLTVKPNPKKASEPEVAVQAEGERVLRSISPQV